jgi:hypothetical protein
LPLSAVDAIHPAFQHTSQQLFRPFRAAQWGKLALVGFLAGELSSGGCSMPNSRLWGGGSGSRRFAPPGLPGFNFPVLPHLAPATLALLVIFLLSTGVLLSLLLIYLNSMMRFVLFDSVIAKKCRIRQSWERRHAAGWRYFVWQLLVAAVTLGGIITLVGVAAGFALFLGWLRHPNQHSLGLIFEGICLFFGLAGLTLASFLVSVLTKDFVVPQMALEDIGAVEGWRRLLPMMKAEIVGYAGYIGMKVVLALGASIVVGIVASIAVLVLLIPVGGLGIVAVLAGKAAGLGWNLYTVTLVVVCASLLLVALLYVISLVSVPATVFFPAYSIYFFAARYRPLGAAVYPLPPAIEAHAGGLFPSGTEPPG